MNEYETVGMVANIIGYEMLRGSRQIRWADGVATIDVSREECLRARDAARRVLAALRGAGWTG